MMSILTWLFPLFSGLADAGIRAVIKLSKAHKFILVSLGFLLSLPYFALWFWISKTTASPETTLWQVLIAHSPLLALANIFQVEAHRLGKLTITGPYLGLTSAFLLITSPLFGFGAANFAGAMGVLILTAGVYLINVREEHVSWLDPIKTIFTEKSSLLMFAVSAIYSITANLNRLGLERAHSSSLYLLLNYSFVALIAGAVALIYLWRGPTDEKIKIKQDFSWKYLVLFGLVFALGEMSLFKGHELIKEVPYVIALKRGGLVTATFLFGLMMGETKDLKWTASGMLFILAGVLLITLRGGI